MISIKRSTSRVSASGGQRTPSAIKTMTRCGKCCYYFRQVTTFLFSHIGLCTLLLGYALVGAFTFQVLESEHEQQQRIEMRNKRDQMVMELSRMTNQSFVLKFDNWTEKAEKILKEFELKFLNAVKHKGYDGSEELGKTSSQWSFSGSLLYSIIVITTIGYGNVAPRTDWGKIVTILYALIGIPLMLFCLSNIGHTMAHSFKFIYWKCCCYLCVKPKKVQRQKRRRIRRKIRKHRRSQHRAMIRMQPIGNHSLNSFEPRQDLSRSSSNKSAIIWNDSIQMDTTNTTPNIPNTPTICPSRNFFETSSPIILNDNENNNTLQLPMKRQQPILSRSFSARYYNELRMNKRNDSKSIRKNPNDDLVTSLMSGNVNIPVICNKYASCSDECIDNVFRSNSEEQNKQHQQINSKTTGQVRFQPSSLLCESSPFPYPGNASIINHRSMIDPPLLSLQSPPSLPFEMNEMNYVPTTPTTINELQSFPHNQHSTLIFNDELSDSSDLSDSDSDDDSDIQEKNIPIIVCLALVISYICGGAWFFSTSEDWSFLDASYFCFITLSTIGFGDLVPGRTVLSTSEDGQMTLAICALYLLFGMALLAMSLNLVKEKVLETVRIIGEQIGILVNDEDNEFY